MASYNPSHGAKVVKAQAYSGDEIFEKRLLLFLPYYLMRYEKMLEEVSSDASRSVELVSCMAYGRSRQSD